MHILIIYIHTFIYIFNEIILKTRIAVEELVDGEGRKGYIGRGTWQHCVIGKDIAKSNINGTEL